MARARKSSRINPIVLLVAFGIAVYLITKLFSGAAGGPTFLFTSQAGTIQKDMSDHPIMRERNGDGGPFRKDTG